MFPVLLRRTVLIVACLVFLASDGSFFVDVFGQRPPLITRTVPRTAGPTSYHAFAPNNLVRIGGVLSQADSLIDLSGDPVSVRIDLAADQPYPGYVNVHRTGLPTPDRYLIEYNDLVPMVLFVDSGGTSLYTLWESDSDRIPEGFEHDAGFVNHRLGGLIALEFQGTRYSDAVYHLDTCLWTCTEPADDDLDSVVERINAGHDQMSCGDIDPCDVGNTYINTDVDLPFRVSTGGNLLFVDGNVARLYPDVSNDRIMIYDAKRIVTSERLPNVARERISLASRVSEMLAELAEVVDARDAVIILQLLVDETASEIEREFEVLESVADAHFLFETLALLRSAKESSLGDWENFRQALESEVLVRANPEPWYRYSRSFCSLYSDDDCQN